MKKLLIVLICLIGICVRGWAQKASPIEGAILGRALGETIAKETQITRDAKDFRILYFLGKEYKMSLGFSVVMSYFNAERDEIKISKQKVSLAEALYQSLDVLGQVGYTIKSRDERNPKDIIYSLYRQKGNAIDYKVMRLFPIGNNEVIQVVVDKKITQQDPLPLMRKVMQGVRATPQKVLNAHFPEGYCEFGEDCY